MAFKKIAKGEEIAEFGNFTLNKSFDEGHGTLYRYDIRKEYIESIKENLDFGDRRLKVVVDCGNGTTSIIARELYSMFPIDLVMLYDESDGNFPNHHPDPIVEENLDALKKKVKEEKADLGIGFDGDGDRSGFVDENGIVLDSSKYSIIILRDILKKNKKKKILCDVKCSNKVKEEKLKLNGNPNEYRTGAPYTMNRMIDDNMLFGFEYSGHIYFNTGFPPISSGLYAGLKLLEILSKTDKKVSEILTDINTYYEEPEVKVASTDVKKMEVVQKIKEYALSKNYKINDIDGVKIYYDDGSWALVRYSNTGPNITARFESKSKEKLKSIKDEFMEIINKYN